jgi:hypothetical protein
MPSRSFEKTLPRRNQGKRIVLPSLWHSQEEWQDHFVINFQSINNQLEQQEYPLTPAEKIFHSIGGFTWATSLNLNMSYLHIRLSQASQELLTIVMPFGFYSCTVLPMEVMPATDIFQSRMVSIFADMGPEKPIPHINDIEPKCTTVKNPTANALVECLHSTLEDQLRTKILGKDFVGKVDYLIQIALFANRATTPSNCAYSPSQLTYGVDMIFRQRILIDWVALKQVH